MISEKKIDAVKNETSPFHIADAIVLVIVVALAVTFAVLSYRKSGEKVIVTYLGEKSEYDISVDREIDIDGKLTLCIEKGAVYVKNAECPDKVCERTGAVNKAGQTIICVPSGITVRIEGGKNDGNKVTTG